MTITDCTINIDRLRVYAYHGVLPAERQVGNEFEVSVRINYDARQALDSDNIVHALNYAEAVNVIEREMAVPSDLLEHVAARIARALCNTFPAVTAGSVTVAKIHPPISSQLSAVSFTLSFHV